MARSRLITLSPDKSTDLVSFNNRPQSDRRGWPEVLPGEVCNRSRYQEKGGTEMVQVLVFVSLVTVIAVYWWHRSSNQKKPLTTSVARRDTRSRYHCVEVCAGNPACESVCQLGRMRFLSQEAPSLPVSGCSAASCTCGFIHHDDRRDDDRRHVYGQWAGIPPEATGERRARIERRTSPESAVRPSMAH